MAGGTGDLTRFLLNPKPPQDQKRRALVERAKDRGNEKRRTRIIKLHVSLDSSTAVIDVCARRSRLLGCDCRSPFRRRWRWLPLVIWLPGLRVGAATFGTGPVFNYLASEIVGRPR